MNEWADRETESIIDIVHEHGHAQACAIIRSKLLRIRDEGLLEGIREATSAWDDKLRAAGAVS